jgi:hypothetical protein
MRGTRDDLVATESNPEDQGLRRLVALTRGTLNAQAVDAHWPVDESGLRRLEQSSSRGLRMRWQATAALGLAALLIVASPVAWFAVRRPGPLTFEVMDGTVGASGEIHPAAAARTEIRFSDGSEIGLGREARAQVGELTADGGKIVLSNGHASTFFVPRPHTRWQVVAGPYTVHVTGTVFDVRWSEEKQAFDVWLKKGSVRVSGPLIGDGIVMTHGQHLLTRVKDNRVSLDNQVDTTEADDAPSAAAAPVPVVEIKDVVAHAGGDRAAPATKSWGRRLAKGDFDAVVEAAEHRGIGSVLAHGTLGELSALADAARYTRRNHLAIRVLSAERERFPDTAQGHEAAFFLGTLAEDGGNHHEAVAWYGRYLRGDGSGTYAAQALGRRMLIESDGSAPAARADAKDYLGRFSNGSYADAARLILKQ